MAGRVNTTTHLELTSISRRCSSDDSRFPSLLCSTTQRLVLIFSACKARRYSGDGVAETLHFIDSPGNNAALLRRPWQLEGKSSSRNQQQRKMTASDCGEFLDVYFSKKASRLCRKQCSNTAVIKICHGSSLMSKLNISSGMLVLIFISDQCSSCPYQNQSHIRTRPKTTKKAHRNLNIPSRSTSSLMSFSCRLT